MSAFVVKNSTLCNIVNGLVRSLDERIHTPFYGLARVSGLVPSTDEEQMKLLLALHKMNVEAVCQRYGSDESKDYPAPTELNRKTPTPIQLLKSLHCYLYQCSEGNIPEQPLFKSLENMSDRLAQSIATALPEYDAEEWG